MKVAHSCRFGAPALSEWQIQRMYELGWTDDILELSTYCLWSSEHYHLRSHPILIQAIEESNSNSWAIVEMPDDYVYNITEYDGLEEVYYHPPAKRIDTDAIKTVISEMKAEAIRLLQLETMGDMRIELRITELLTWASKLEEALG